MEARTMRRPVLYITGTAFLPYDLGGSCLALHSTSNKATRCPDLSGSCSVCHFQA